MGEPSKTPEINQRTLADFEELQRKLVPLWHEIGRSDPGGPVQPNNTIVVLPSLSIDLDIPITVQQAYEERFLFMLFLLRQPRIRIVYITSMSIRPEIIDYYLATLPGVIITNARKRLFLVSPDDGSHKPLTQKLLERPRLIEYIRSFIPDPDQAHIVPFNTTDLERAFAVRLGLPMYAPDPGCFAFGTKSGGRRVFAEENVAHPAGAENLFSEEQIIEAILGMRRIRPDLRELIIKLNQGVGGTGNAVISLDSAPPSGDSSEREQIARCLTAMQFELEDVSYEPYLAKIVEHGAIIEEFISGEAYSSPSAQLRVTPMGEVEMLSTHDQMLGGPSGQSYLGARFPARPEYSWLIMREAIKIGRRLAKEGVVGRFAVDFVVVRSASGKWDPYAIEINLRKGGTTAPFLTLQYLTDGVYDAREGVFITARGHEKCYVSSDHVESAAYTVFTASDLFDILCRHRLHFDHTNQTGVVLHMISGVGGLGQFGVTAIHDTLEDAEALYNQLLAILDREAQAWAQS